MKKYVLALSCCTLALSATMASAAGVYVSGNIGLAAPPALTATAADSREILNADISFSTGLALTGAVGYDFGGFRAEAELGYQQNNSDDTDWSLRGAHNTATFATTSFANCNLTSSTLFANGYYDFKNNSPFTPYLGAGLGVAKVELKDVSFGRFLTNYSADDTVFAYQFIAGTSYSITKNVAIDLSYRYVSSSEPSLDFGYGRGIDLEFSSHNFMLGGRYTF